MKPGLQSSAESVPLGDSTAPFSFLLSPQKAAF